MNKKNIRLRQATVVYCFLLAYIIAALLWWFISLEKQSHQMADFETAQLNIASQNNTNDPGYAAALELIKKKENRRTAQYVGEGVTFLLIILVGALFVYKAVRRQLRLSQQQENFMMAITHELKTPIAITKLNLETLQKYPLDEPKKQKVILSALQETNRLHSLTNNILISSQLEGGRYQSSFEDISLSDLLNNAVQENRRRFPDRAIVSEITPELELKGDTLLLQILINNLLENAIKYSPKEGTITCSLQATDAHYILSVKDEGPGIDPAEKERIFQKFYRPGNELTRTTKGTGLGLYLCKKIAADHKADIRVTNNTPVGSNFAVWFRRS
jgi:two-component system, OmpR family, sensor histidine kinase CiaH